MRDIVIVGINGQVIGIDAASGQQRWQDGLKGGGYGEVALAATDRHVFASAQGSMLFCFNYATGELLWKEETTSSGRASIVVQDERVYVAKGGEVNCFTFEGRRLWSQGLPGMGFGSVSIGFPGNIVQADDRGSK
jgi:outer membrane protein assembly factor BamB